jgi:hypothetical protein
MAPLQSTASLSVAPEDSVRVARVGVMAGGMFYVFGTEISTSDARYLLAALGGLGTPDADDAANMINLGLTGKRDTIPLSPQMREAVKACLDEDLDEDLPEGLVELRTKLERRTLLARDWRDW